MITRVLTLPRLRSRRRRPSRFPARGYPRGAAGRLAPLGVVSSAGFARATWGEVRKGGVPPFEVRHMRSGGLGADLVGAAVMVAGIVLWGGLFVLLAG